ncbi:hypothetical protein Tco_1428235 [Tanacetum coccineum]
MPSLPSPEPTISCIDDLDFFKDFENEFPAIAYDDDLKSKSDQLIEPFVNMTPLPSRDQRHPWLMYRVKGYGEDIVHSYEQRLKTIWGRMSDTEMGLDVDDTLCFQLGGVRRRMTWRQFILALGLHSEEEMAEVDFGAYWQGSERVIPDKGDIRDYWIEISSDRDFLGPNPFYVFIQDPVRRLCHGMIACSISGRGQAPKKVIGVDLFYLYSIDRGTANVPHLLAQYLFRHAEGRKSGARLSEVTSLGVLQPILDWQSDVAAGAPGAAEDDPANDKGAEVNPAPVQAPQPPPPAPRTIQQRISRLEEEDAIWRIVGFGIRRIDLLYRPCCKSTIWYTLKKTCVELILMVYDLVLSVRHPTYHETPPDQAVGNTACDKDDQQNALVILEVVYMDDSVIEKKKAAAKKEGEEAEGAMTVYDEED